MSDTQVTEKPGLDVEGTVDGLVTSVIRFIVWVFKGIVRAAEGFDKKFKEEWNK